VTVLDRATIALVFFPASEPMNPTTVLDPDAATP
jgi:hypothetical protein